MRPASPAGATPRLSQAEVALRSVLTALMLVCILFTVIGEAILKLFSVSVPAFQIGGGIIVLLFSLDMVMGEKQAGKDDTSGSAKNDADRADADPSIDIATYPLAIPLMWPPSRELVAIVSLIAQRNDVGSVLYLVGVIIAIMAISTTSASAIIPAHRERSGPGRHAGRRQTHGRDPGRIGRQEGSCSWGLPPSGSSRNPAPEHRSSIQYRRDNPAASSVRPASGFLNRSGNFAGPIHPTQPM